MGSRKGQTLIFEQVLIFSISVAIFAASFMVFSSYQGHYTSITSEDHMKEVKDFVTSNIIKIGESGDFNSTIIASIPQTIGSGPYDLVLTKDSLTINLDDGRSDYFSMETLNKTFKLSGKMTSSSGTIVIYKTGDSIIIR